MSSRNQLVFVAGILSFCLMNLTSCENASTLSCPSSDSSCVMMNKVAGSYFVTVTNIQWKYSFDTTSLGTTVLEVRKVGENTIQILLDTLKLDAWQFYKNDQHVFVPLQWNVGNSTGPSVIFYDHNDSISFWDGSADFFGSLGSEGSGIQYNGVKLK